MNSDDEAFLSRGKKALYGLLAPLVVGVVGFWLIGVATHGEGPSVGGRSMVLFRAVSCRNRYRRCAKHVGVVCASPVSSKRIPSRNHSASDRACACICLPVADLAISALGY